MKNNPKFPKSWIVRAYKNSSLIDTFEIKDKFQWEANEEAQNIINKLGNKVDEWVMVKG